MADKETRLLHEYVHETMNELKLSKAGRASLSAIKTSLASKIAQVFGFSSGGSFETSDEQQSFESALKKWFEQTQKIDKKRISLSKMREIKNYAEQTYKKFTQNDDEDVAITKTLRALDKKYASNA